MKTERVTLLTTAAFKAFLATEAQREGVSVAELVRNRCEQRPSTDEAILASLASELQTAVRGAQTSLLQGLADADVVLRELRARRGTAQQSKPRGRNGQAAAGRSAK